MYLILRKIIEKSIRKEKREKERTNVYQSNKIEFRIK